MVLSLFFFYRFVTLADVAVFASLVSARVKSAAPHFTKHFLLTTFVLSLSLVVHLRSRCSMLCQVTVVGAAGGIGQPMSLLLKLSGKIEHLSLFDIVNTPGVAADISHCDSMAKASKQPRQE